MELSSYALEPLRPDEECILCRGDPRQAAAPFVFLRMPATTRRALASLKKLEDECSLKIVLGIPEDDILLGSHLIRFRHTDSEFERGVRFLDLEVAKELIQCSRLGPGRAQGR